MAAIVKIKKEHIKHAKFLSISLSLIYTRMAINIPFVKDEIVSHAINIYDDY